MPGLQPPIIQPVAQHYTTELSGLISKPYFMKLFMKHMSESTIIKIQVINRKRRQTFKIKGTCHSNYKVVTELYFTYLVHTV